MFLSNTVLDTTTFEETVTACEATVVKFCTHVSYIKSFQMKGRHVSPKRSVVLFM